MELHFSQSGVSVRNASLLLAGGLRALKVCLNKVSGPPGGVSVKVGAPPDEVMIKLCEQGGARFASMHSPITGACAVEAVVFPAGD